MDNTMSNYRPIIGITMGDPVGIGPEILCRALSGAGIFDISRPVVFGDAVVMRNAAAVTGSALDFREIESPEDGSYTPGTVDILGISRLDADALRWGTPTAATGQAMIDYILAAVDMARDGRIDAVTTCPINKAAMKLAGSKFHGHTEMIASRTNTGVFAMMMAGSRLRVVLVTIHIPLRSVPKRLTTESIETVIALTDHSLKFRFGIPQPRIAVAGLNPHSGEEGMFGDEESRVIAPAVANAVRRGIDAEGPIPPDTLFYHAAKGAYDAVVCMYHDQGLIPFKMIHFADGVNTTLGLPIIRTSVDHGTAYDIAGKGMADPGSLVAAIEMAAEQAGWLKEISEPDEEQE